MWKDNLYRGRFLPLLIICLFPMTEPWWFSFVPSLTDLLFYAKKSLRWLWSTEVEIGWLAYQGSARGFLTKTHSPQLEDSTDVHAGRAFFARHQPAARTDPYVNLREVSSRMRLPRGQYLIVPSTFEPYKNGEFCLRVFAEKQAKSQWVSSLKPPQPLLGRQAKEKVRCCTPGLIFCLNQQNRPIFTTFFLPWSTRVATHPWQSHGSSELSTKHSAGNKVPQLCEGEVPTIKECRIWEHDDDEMVLKKVVSIAAIGWKSRSLDGRQEQQGWISHGKYLQRVEAGRGGMGNMGSRKSGGLFCAFVNTL